MNLEPGQTPTEQSKATYTRRLDQVDVDNCRDALRGGSRSFFAASFFLPKEFRNAASILYGYCRAADDIVDNGGGRAALESLVTQLDRVYRGQPEDDAMERAFTWLVHTYDMPRALPEALLEGFIWDTEGRSYETISDVRAYGARVAGTVGAMMTILMGVRDTDAHARATDLGVAMQLSNIARDVGEDARNGRIYVPTEWLVDAGVDPDALLAGPQFSPGLGHVVERLLEEAEMLYTRAAAGIPELPSVCRPGIEAARVLYREIGREVARNGYDSISQRAVVSPTRKAAVLASAMIKRKRPAEALDHDALPETSYLVNAVAEAGPGPIPTLRTFGERIAWTIDLFEKLGERDRAQMAEAGRD